MRVLHLILITLFIVVVGSVTVAFLDLAEIPVVSELAHGVKGYGLAKTPEEATDRYKKALEDRNYKMAARFLDGDYAVQMRKHAKIATKLGKSIDNFRAAAKDRSLVNDQVELMLARVELFPKSINIKDVKPAGDDKAVAFITTESGSRFIPRTGRPIALKKTDGVWRIDLLLTPDDRNSFDNLDKFGQDLVNALDSVKSRMKTDATTKENVAKDLKDELHSVDPAFTAGIR